MEYIFLLSKDVVQEREYEWLISARCGAILI
jgi:hypothetical protein